MSDRITERQILFDRLRNALQNGLVRIPIDCSETESDRHAPTVPIAGSCRGCKHWVGAVHRGTLFVCAMHPYGQKDCPDKEFGELYETGNSVYRAGKVFKENPLKAGLT